MRIELQDIPGLSEDAQTVHKIMSMSVNGKNLARSALSTWKKNCPADWKKLLKAIRFVGTHERKEIQNCKYVEKCDNPKLGDVYEFRAHKGKPRLFFFFNPFDDSVVICTNSYKKDDSQRGKTAGQDAAFARCAEMKNLYVRSRK